MLIDIQNEVLAVEDGTYQATIDTIQPYGEEDGIIMRLLLEDQRILVKFYRESDLGSFPWNGVFRALNTNDTDDLVGKAVELEVVNNTSKKTDRTFCNIKRVTLK